jgi:hypothetical protein
MYLLAAWASFLVIVVVTVYGLVESLYVTGKPIGYILVNVYFPFPPYFAQPVTYFSVACVALFYSGLRLWEEYVAKWPNWLLMSLQVFGFVIAFSAAYEVMYNFMVWGALFSVACANTPACNPDILASTYPSQWSLVFATRAFSALFVISGYSVYYLRKFSSSAQI